MDRRADLSGTVGRRCHKNMERRPADIDIRHHLEYSLIHMVAPYSGTPGTENTVQTAEEGVQNCQKEVSPCSGNS